MRLFAILRNHATLVFVRKTNSKNKAAMKTQPTATFLNCALQTFGLVYVTDKCVQIPGYTAPQTVSTYRFSDTAASNPVSVSDIQDYFTKNNYSATILPSDDPEYFIYASNIRFRKNRHKTVNHSIRFDVCRPPQYHEINKTFQSIKVLDIVKYRITEHPSRFNITGILTHSGGKIPFTVNVYKANPLQPRVHCEILPIKTKIYLSVRNILRKLLKFNNKHKLS